MHCENCKKALTTFIIEGDFGADPLWCGQCLANLELEEMPLSEALVTELTTWMCDFGEWIDIENDSFIEGAEHLAQAHDGQGTQLAQKVAAELGTGVTVKFSPYLTN
ncbi:hypothetical protein AEA09_18505 [Lysinibacillus contaminans]|uniref:Uncharacterized protein n=1 Tax=Lysinibacillus contaminans TaxID=1293441 RepID=A0ABR5JX26_9BACI|nr:hypothetical protein [Lysinibacillus contaminans]KOS66720.1 hypothetical protein AEA09_18505 [Lysinibacillus contaminans]